MFFKILKYDLKNTVLKKYKNYLFVFGMFSFFLAAFCIQAYMWEIPDITISEMVFYLFMGMKEFIPTGLDKFSFPAMWMLIFILLLYYTLYYPYNDIMGYGKNVLIASGSRTKWWLSKCVTTFFMAALYFLAAALSVLIFALASGADFSLEVKDYVAAYFTENPAMWDAPEPNSFDLVLTIYILPFASAIAFCMLQMLFTLIVRPFPALIITVSVLMVSAYYQNPFAIGNYAMTQRSICFIPNGGVNPQIGIVVMLSVTVLSVIISTVLFNRYEILGKE